MWPRCPVCTESTQLYNLLVVHDCSIFPNGICEDSGNWRRTKPLRGGVGTQYFRFIPQIAQHFYVFGIS
jgi:hypothetical protein